MTDRPTNERNDYERFVTVLSHDPRRRKNAQAIEDAAALGWLRPEDLVLDMTHNAGRFWRLWCPERLVRMDIAPGDERGPFALDVVGDATLLPFADDVFDTCVFDPPYKFAGTVALESDASYGVDRYRTPTDLVGLYAAGLAEAHRVTRPGGVILVKAQDACVSGRFVRQCSQVADIAAGLGLVERAPLHVTSHRQQPAGKTQTNAWATTSTLMIFSVRKRKLGRREAA